MLSRTAIKVRKTKRDLGSSVLRNPLNLSVKTVPWFQAFPFRQTVNCRN